MPALDYINKTEEKTADISAGITNSTNGVALGRAGLAKAEGVTVIVTEASTANFNTTNVRGVTFSFELSTDNGTTWYTLAQRSARVSAAGVPKQIIWMPVEYDIPPENYNATNALLWRVSADWEEALASTDDFNFQGWLGNQDLGLRVGLLNGLN